MRARSLSSSKGRDASVSLLYPSKVHGASTRVLRLAHIPRVDVGVQSRVGVAQNQVVDSKSVGHFKQRVTNDDHIAEKLPALRFQKLVDVSYHGVS